MDRFLEWTSIAPIFFKTPYIYRPMPISPFIAHLTLVFAFQFIIVAGLFFLKRQSRQGNVLLGVVMLILAFQHFMHYLWATQKVYQYTWLLNIDLPLDGCIPPLLLFYISAMTGERLRFRPAMLLHFWPLAVGAVWYIYFNLQPLQFKTNFIDMAYREVPALASVTNLLMAVYLGIGYRKLDRYIKSQPSTEWVSGYSNLAWLRQFVAIMFVLNVGMAPLNFIARFSYIIAGFPAITGGVILFIVYKTFNHPEVMSTELIRKYTQQLEYQRELEKVRHQISSDIHDELGAGLTRISMLSELGKMQHKTDEATRGEFARLVDISHSLMGTLREVVWAINPVHDNLNSLLAYLRQYISTFFDPTDIRISMNFPDDPGDIALDPYMRRNLILIVKEACNNIIKHARATEVTVTCAIESGYLQLLITDNGIGGPATTSVLGNGLRNIEKRIVASGGKVQVTTEPGKGFTISIWCPLPHITQK